MVNVSSSFLLTFLQTFEATKRARTVFDELCSYYVTGMLGYAETKNQFGFGNTELK